MSTRQTNRIARKARLRRGDAPKSGKRRFNRAQRRIGRVLCRSLGR